MPLVQHVVGALEDGVIGLEHTGAGVRLHPCCRQLRVERLQLRGRRGRSPPARASPNALGAGGWRCRGRSSGRGGLARGCWWGSGRGGPGCGGGGCWRRWGAVCRWVGRRAGTPAGDVPTPAWPSACVLSCLWTAGSRAGRCGAAPGPRRRRGSCGGRAAEQRRTHRSAAAEHAGRAPGRVETARKCSCGFNQRLHAAARRGEDPSTSGASRNDANGPSAKGRAHQKKLILTARRPAFRFLGQLGSCRPALDGGQIAPQVAPRLTPAAPPSPPHCTWVCWSARSQSPPAAPQRSGRCTACTRGRVWRAQQQVSIERRRPSLVEQRTPPACSRLRRAPAPEHGCQHHLGLQLGEELAYAVPAAARR